METRAAYAAVGAFVVVLAASLLVTVLWLAHTQLQEDTTRYDIYFASVSTGLVRGSPVRISGVQEGRVIDVALDPRDPSRVRVTIEVRTDAPIRSDSVASVEMTALTGGAAVEITPGSKSAPPVRITETERYPVIWSRESDMQQVVASIPTLLAKLTDLTDRLAATVDDKNRASLAQVLDNLNRVTAVAAARSADLNRLIAGGAADMADLKSAIDSVNAAAIKVDGVAVKASGAVDDFRGLVQENRAPLREFTENGLDQLQQLLTDTHTLVATMTRTVDSIERDPSQLIYGDRRQGYRPQ
jgi:phospholipid/cholesterol/gamma-HCH transport system substrate-binding protein